MRKNCLREYAKSMVQPLELQPVIFLVTEASCSLSAAQVASHWTSHDSGKRFNSKYSSEMFNTNHSQYIANHNFANVDNE